MFTKGDDKPISNLGVEIEYNLTDKEGYLKNKQ